MKTIKLENGKEVKISEESYNALVDAVNEDNIDNNTSLVESYVAVCNLDKPKIKTTERKNNQIYVNQIFDDKSVFGSNCVFIKCKFGSGCKFDSFCKFGSYCRFGSDCEFGSSCKFGSYCRFGSDCEFGSSCEFGSNCRGHK